MDRQIQIVTISLNALLDAPRFKTIVLLDQLEKDGIDLHCFINTCSSADGKAQLKQAQLLQYFDRVITAKPQQGIFLTSVDKINYASIMLTLGQRRPRLPLAVMLNLYAVDPLNEEAILDG